MRYEELCAIRDGVNKANEPDQKLLDAANLRVQEAQAIAWEIAMRINDAKLAANWIELNKEIATLARGQRG